MSSPLRSGAPTARTDLLRALADHLASLEHASPLRIGIDGASASGKTSLADELAVALGGRDREVIRASGDDFHHPRAIRHARGRHCAEGYYLDAFDCERLVTWLLDPLGPDADRAYRTASHDLASDARLCPPIEHAGASALLLFDGMFLQRPETRGGFDVVIHLQVEPSILRTRAVTRDTALFGDAKSATAAYDQRYDPAHRMYTRDNAPAERADIVIDNTRLQAPEILRVR